MNQNTVVRQQYAQWESNRIRAGITKIVVGLLMAGLLLAQPAYASDRWNHSGSAAHLGASVSEVELKKRYALGIGRFDLDAHTEIIGWRLNNAWYFGRQDGMDSGLTLVWQQNLKQISLSKDGVRLTQRF